MKVFNSKLSWVLLVVLVAIPIFVHFDKQPIRMWDEARLAMNAYEMNKNGNWLVTHFEGQPDMWNTKPPLMIWLQVIFIKILEFTELAIRLPSAIAALFTCLIMAVFSKRYFNDAMPGMIACLVLVTTNGYIHIHACRTGDYDALLAMFTTLFCFFALMYAEKKSIKYLHFFFVGLTLSVLTKSIQGLLFFPAVGLFAGKAFLRNKWFYIDVGIFLLIAGGYYLLREKFNPGYLHAIWENELGGRYLNTLEDNRQGPFYYVQQLRTWLFKPWFWVSIAGVIAGYFSEYKKFTIYITLLSITYLLLISVSQTKLEWYAVPLYPFLSFMVSILLCRVVQVLQNWNWWAPIVFLAAVFAYPYLEIGRKVYNPTEYEWDRDVYPISYVLQDAYRGHSSLNN